MTASALKIILFLSSVDLSLSLGSSSLLKTLKTVRPRCRTRPYLKNCPSTRRSFRPVSDPFRNDDLEALVGDASPLSDPMVGMPWTASISGDPADRLKFMHFWTWQLSYMREHLADLELVPYPPDLTYRENRAKQARVVTLTFRSREYRKIRLTYYDGGPAIQIFNSLWYPSDALDLPLLGGEMLGFRRGRHLAVVDHLPVREGTDLEPAHAAALARIRRRHPPLWGEMSDRFYDPTRYRSGEMLFGRFEGGEGVGEHVFPAFRGYVQEHVRLAREALREGKPMSDEARKGVRRRQAAYDQYNMERDPAKKMFAGVFGKEWAERFHASLFEFAVEAAGLE